MSLKMVHHTTFPSTHFITQPFVSITYSEFIYKTHSHKSSKLIQFQPFINHYLIGFPYHHICIRISHINGHSLSTLHRFPPFSSFCSLTSHLMSFDSYETRQPLPSPRHITTFPSPRTHLNEPLAKFKRRPQSGWKESRSTQDHWE